MDDPICQVRYVATGEIQVLGMEEEANLKRMLPSFSNAMAINITPQGTNLPIQSNVHLLFLSVETTHKDQM